MILGPDGRPLSRRRMPAEDEAAARILAMLLDSGRLIEGGWLMLRGQVISPDAPAIQVDSMRLAYYAGVQHLWRSILDGMTASDEITELDEKRMGGIEAEVAAWEAEQGARAAAYRAKQEGAGK